VTPSSASLFLRVPQSCCPHGGLQTFQQKSTCLTLSTYEVEIWSRYLQNYGGTKSCSPPSGWRIKCASSLRGCAVRWIDAPPCFGSTPSLGAASRGARLMVKELLMVKERPPLCKHRRLSGICPTLILTQETRQRSAHCLRTLVYSVIYDSGQVSLKNFSEQKILKGHLTIFLTENTQGTPYHF